MSSSPLLHYYDLGTEVVAFSTTRHGGVSHDAYGSFNINRFCGDDAQCVSVNQHLLASTLGIEPERIVMPHQVHGIEVRAVAPELFAMSDGVRNHILDGVDAVMTSMKGVCIGVSTADCIPVLVYDAEAQVAAAIHAGWRGTLQRICQKTINDMRLQYGCLPQRLQVVIGPGISLANFEVGDEVYQQFVDAGFDLTHTAEWRGKWHLDLPQINHNQLVEAGIDEAHIQYADICTYDHVDDYFSARRLGIESGRIYTAIMLR